MSYQISNFTDNDDIKTLDQQGPFSIIEYQRDLSVTPASALNAYYCSQMNVRKRQVVCDLSKGRYHDSGWRHAVDAGRCQCHHWYQGSR